MTYEEVLDFLYSQLPMFQRKGKAAYKDNLDNTLALDKHFSYPHKNFKTIHIAGTNGKGSISHMIASVLQEAKYNVGLYTSPHLKDFRERVKINGEMMEKGFVTGFVLQNKAIIEKLKPSFFEITVAMAFEYFKERKVDIAIIETGLGGRLDSTNIVEPELSIITNIGMDHTDLLGSNLEAIAKEKAGIIKPNTPLVVGEKQERTIGIFEEKAKETKTSLLVASETIEAKNIHKKEKGSFVFDIYIKGEPYLKNCGLDLKGDYQIRNVKTAIAAISLLNSKGTFHANEENIKKGLANVAKNTGLMGRWQILSRSPFIICDTGHNIDGMKQIVEQLGQMEFEQLHFVLGTVNDKNISAILEILPKTALYYFTQANIPRALNGEELSDLAKKEGLNGEVYPTVAKALEMAKLKAKPKDLIFVGGSTFVVAEVV